MYLVVVLSFPCSPCGPTPPRACPHAAIRCETRYAQVLGHAMLPCHAFSSAVSAAPRPGFRKALPRAVQRGAASCVVLARGIGRQCRVCRRNGRDRRRLRTGASFFDDGEELPVPPDALGGSVRLRGRRMFGGGAGSSGRGRLTQRRHQTVEPREVLRVLFRVPVFAVAVAAPGFWRLRLLSFRRTPLASSPLLSMRRGRAGRSGAAPRQRLGCLR